MPTVHNVAGANMAGGVASALLERDAPASQLGLFEVDEFWLADGRRRARAARDRARQPVPRPARPLRRARDDRRALGGARRSAAPTQLVLNADDPLIADLGRERPGRALLRHRGPAAASAPRARARLGLDALPQLRRRLRATRTSTSRHLGDYACPSCGAERPRPAVSATTSRSTGCAARASSCAHRTASARGAHLAARASTTSTTRSPRRRSRPRSAIEPADDRRRARRGLGGVRARRARRASASASSRSCWSRTPPAPTRCCACSARRTARTTCSRVLNDAIADGRDVSWIWDADFETLAPRIAPRHLLGHARRRAGAAPEVRRRPGGADHASSRTLEARSTGALARARAASSTRCRPTRRCSRCASCYARGAGRRARGRAA